MYTNNRPTLRHATLLLWLVAAVGCAYAQPASSPGAPSEPHDALAFFEGTWTTSDAAPEEDFKETCAWLPEGRRHMICRSRWRAEAGHREGLSIFSYDSSASEYRYHGFRAGGAVVTLSGRRLPKGLLFSSDRGTGPDRMQTRVTIEKTAPDRFSFLSESAKGDGPWQVGAKVEYVRVGR
jgi:hypothetical protein